MSILPKSSNDKSAFYLLRSLIKGDSIGENGVQISYSERELDDKSLILMFNIDIERGFMRPLRSLIRHVIPNISRLSLPDVFLIYAEQDGRGNIKTGYFAIELGFHDDHELQRKEDGLKELFERMGIQLNKLKTLNVVSKSSSHRKIRHLKFLRVRANSLLQSLPKYLE